MKKLSFIPYNRRFIHFTTVFDLLRHALGDLTDASMKRYMQSQRKPLEEEKEKLDTFIKAHHKIASGTDLVSPLVDRIFRKTLSSDLPLNPGPKWAEYQGQARLEINASELILLVALFEAFMKGIHEHALWAKPKLLAEAVQNRRPEELKALAKILFCEGFDALKAKEIQRQVLKADRDRPKERAGFFKDALHLPWGDTACVESVANLIAKRHALAHGAPGEHASEQDIKQAREHFMGIPSQCFNKAGEIYPSHFGN